VLRWHGLQTEGSAVKKNTRIKYLRRDREGATTGIQMDALPRGSKGKSSASAPAPKISAPETYTGTTVSTFAYNAMIGA
jgi:hypothetical protein